MALLDFLLQGMQPRNHKQVINELLELNSPEVLISIAFLRDNGFQLIKDKLSLIPSERIKFFVGARNDITSMQGVYSILKEGYSIYIIDTGASDFIYHPKVYLSQNEEKAKVIIGSSNLTKNGLMRNIEASVLIDLDKTIVDDEEFLIKIVDSLNNLPILFPNNVIEITNVRQIISLKNEGRLVDERVSRNIPSSQNNISTRIDRERIPRMNIEMESSRRATTNRRIRRISRITNTRNNWELVWISSPLTERDLNVPTGGNTHSTGSMGMKKGELDGIDHRHYFREEVFNELDWVVSPTTSNPLREIAALNSYLTIRGISYPLHSLNITHDPRTNTRTYEQRNFVTSLRWGTSKPLIAQSDLLGSHIRLYKRIINTNVEYLIELN